MLSGTRLGAVVTLKVLIISSHRTNCGIAAYSEVLKTLLETRFEVTIAPLDQTILKRTEPHVVTAGDQQIRAICDSFGQYDVINLQWEPGLLGGRDLDMARRFEMIIDAADRLLLTVHTAVPYPEGRGPIDFARFVRNRGWRRALKFPFHQRFERLTYNAIEKRTRSPRPFFVATHNKRERDFFKQVARVPNVFDHPLCHLRAGWPSLLEKEGPAVREELSKRFPGKNTFIGVFGFLSEYKGIMTAIKAMRHLGSEYHLLIYGGVHPEAIKPRTSIDPYIKQILEEIERAEPGTGGRPKADSDLLGRISFLGAPRADYDFALAVKAVDICLFPYLEVGQSGSGPASHAIELGKPTILTRTRAFLELEKYFPAQFEMIDVGNYIELAQTIRSLSQTKNTRPQPGYNSKTLANFYGDLISRCAGAQGGHERLTNSEPITQRAAE